jgi:nickel/cobalt transporter (NicO) family protein
MKRRTAILGMVLLTMFCFVPVVSAHPLGNFTINHFTEIQVNPGYIRVDFVLDMAEIPTFQEISVLDVNHNGKADPDELAGYPERQCALIGSQLELGRNNSPVALKLENASIAFPPGAGGLPTLRLSCNYHSSAVQFQSQDQLTFQDHSYSDRLGWREMIVTAQGGVTLSGSYAAQSVSNRLTSYPKDLLSSPLDVRQVSFRVGPGGSEAQNSGISPPVGILPGWSAARSDRFTELITLQNLTPATIAFALLIAFIWGGLHSMTPGHGKTIVGAYLVGARGTAKHALILGILTTVTHTAGVFLIGLITLFASKYILPEQLFPWIGLISGFLVVSIGINLVISRLRSRRQMFKPAFIAAEKHPLGEVSLAGNGRLPVSRLQIQPLREERVHLFEQGSHTHVHEPGEEHLHPHSHAADSVHSHGPGEPLHSHLPPGSGGEPVTWRNLLALGISGGLLPCPSALVVLLSAIALGRVGFGIVLVLAFSLGLAGVLTAIGLLLVYARRFFDRLPVQSRWIELIPAGSALFITIIGAWITIQALGQLGWIRF